MDVNNEINKHKPYDIDDISSVRFDLKFEESVADLPECIICKLTEEEDYYEDLSMNAFCDCKFYYHESCYEEWIQYKKENKCLICDQDISSNFYITSPEISPRNRHFVLTRRERLLLRRMQIRERPIGCDDIFCNIICCRFPYNRRNCCLTWTQLNEDSINKTVVCSLFVLIGVALVIFLCLLLSAPWMFRGIQL